MREEFPDAFNPGPPRPAITSIADAPAMMVCASCSPQVRVFELTIRRVSSPSNTTTVGGQWWQWQSSGDAN
jgi:hypothetical protein